MKKFDLNIVRNGYYYGYDVTYDATISNAFAAAAFRFVFSQSQMSKKFLISLILCFLHKMAHRCNKPLMTQYC